MIQYKPKYKDDLVLSGKGDNRRWRKRDTAGVMGGAGAGGFAGFLGRREVLRGRLFDANSNLDTTRAASARAVAEQENSLIEVNRRIADSKRLGGTANKTIDNHNKKLIAAIIASNNAGKPMSKKQIEQSLEAIRLQASKVQLQEQSRMAAEAMLKEAKTRDPVIRKAAEQAVNQAESLVRSVLNNPMQPKKAGIIGAGIGAAAGLGTMGTLSYLRRRKAKRKIRKEMADAIE